MKYILFLLLLVADVATAQTGKTPRSQGLPTDAYWYRGDLWVDSAVRFASYRYINDTVLSGCDSAGRLFRITKSQIKKWSAGDSVTWSLITGKPATFVPAAHTHPQSQITGLSSSLDSLRNRSNSTDSTIYATVYGVDTGKLYLTRKIQEIRRSTTRDILAWFRLGWRDFYHNPIGAIKEIRVTSNYYVGIPKNQIVRSFIIRFYFDSTRDLLVEVGFNGISATGNDYVINIANVALVLKATATSKDAVTAGLIAGGGPDEAAPFRAAFTGYEVLSGGNHGWPGLTVTSTAHGLAFNDVGSPGVDATGKKYTLLERTSDNTFFVIASDSLGKDNLIYLLAAAPAVSPLTFNTPTGIKTVAFSATPVQNERYNMLSSHDFGYLINGKIIPIDSNATYYPVDSQLDVKFYEDYVTVYAPSLPKFWAAQRPPGGYTSNPSFTVGEPFVRIRNLWDAGTYGKFTQYWNFELYIKGLTRGDYGGTQHQFDFGADTFIRTTPYLYPVTNNGYTYDFRTGENMNARAWVGATYIPPTSVAPGQYLDWTFDKVTGNAAGGKVRYNFNLGYLADFRDFDKSLNPQQFLFFPNRKLYPYDWSRNYPNPGSYSGILVRGIDTIPSAPGLINSTIFHAQGFDYLRMDFNAAGTYNVPVRAGYKFDPVRMSDNASFNPDANTVTVVTDTPMVANFMGRWQSRNNSPVQPTGAATDTSWKLGGNNNPSARGIGNTNSQPLNLLVNNATAARFDSSGGKYFYSPSGVYNFSISVANNGTQTISGNGSVTADRQWTFTDLPQFNAGAAVSSAAGLEFRNGSPFFSSQTLIGQLRGGSNAFALRYNTTSPGIYMSGATGAVAIGTETVDATAKLRVAGIARFDAGTNPVLIGPNASFSTVSSVSMNGTLSDSLMNGFFSEPGTTGSLFLNSRYSIFIRPSGTANNGLWKFSNTGNFIGGGSYSAAGRKKFDLTGDAVITGSIWYDNVTAAPAAPAAGCITYAMGNNLYVICAGQVTALKITNN